MKQEKLLPITFEPRLGLLAGEDEVTEVVRGAHGMDGDVKKGARVKARNLDVTAQGREVAVEGAKLVVAPVVVGVLRRPIGRPIF